MKTARRLQQRATTETSNVQSASNVPTWLRCPAAATKAQQPASALPALRLTAKESRLAAQNAERWSLPKMVKSRSLQSAGDCASTVCTITWSYLQSICAKNASLVVSRLSPTSARNVAEGRWYPIPCTEIRLPQRAIAIIAGLATEAVITTLHGKSRIQTSCLPTKFQILGRNSRIRGCRQFVTRWLPNSSETITKIR